MKKQKSKKDLTLEKFIEITINDLEKKISEMITDKHIVTILSGGKRLRPLLANLTFKACTQGKESAEEYQRALEGGVIIELAHAASLVHDDIIDEDKERRGKPAFHIKEGVASAILTGHKMLITGFTIALKHGSEWAKLYVKSWNEVVNGEIDEIEFNKNGINGDDLSSKTKIFEKYYKIIDLKTAELFSSVCKAGAIEANMSGDILKIIADYGREIGIAYQLADDLVDLENGEMINSVVVPLLNKLDKENGDVTRLNVRKIKKKFNKNKDKIKEIYIEEIKKHLEKAKKLGKSEKIPKSIYKNFLADFPSYIINKMLKEINIKV